METHANKMRLFFARHVAFQACLFSRSDRITYLTSNSYILVEGKPEYPQFELHAGIKMALVLGSPLYICGLSTTHHRLSGWAVRVQCKLTSIFHMNHVCFQITRDSRVSEHPFMNQALSFENHRRVTN